jgi:hypothetical protein
MLTFMLRVPYIFLHAEMLNIACRQAVASMSAGARKARTYQLVADDTALLLLTAPAAAAGRRAAWLAIHAA